LIAKAEIFGEGAAAGYGVDFIGQFTGGFPDFQVFEIGDGHGCFSFYIKKFETLERLEQLDRLEQLKPLERLEQLELFIHLVSTV
jgi:hypothetical protein